jgi:hypothetical protein
MKNLFTIICTICFLLILEEGIAQNFRPVSFSYNSYFPNVTDPAFSIKRFYRYKNPNVLFNQLSDEIIVQNTPNGVIPSDSIDYDYNSTNPPRQILSTSYNFDGVKWASNPKSKITTTHTVVGNLRQEEYITLNFNGVDFEPVGKSIALFDAKGNIVKQEYFNKNSNGLVKTTEINTYFNPLNSYVDSMARKSYSFDTGNLILAEIDKFVYDSQNRNTEILSYKVDLSNNSRKLIRQQKRTYIGNSSSYSQIARSYDETLDSLIIVSFDTFEENSEMVDIIVYNVLNNDINQKTLRNRYNGIFHQPSISANIKNLSKYTAYDYIDNNWSKNTEYEWEYEAVSKSVEYNAGLRLELLQNIGTDQISFYSDENSSKVLTYFIQDVNGKIVSQSSMVPSGLSTINIQNLAQGQYFIMFPSMNKKALPFVKM